MKYYHKIKNIFLREEGRWNNLIEGVFADPAVEFLRRNRWVWTEKVDGTNIAIYWDGYRVHIHGRTERSDIPKELQERLHELFLGDDKEQLFEQIFGEKEVILYGEGYGNKIQKVGKKYSNHQDFILFDVYFPQSDVYLSRDDVSDIAYKFGIQIVPVVGWGTLYEAVDFVKTSPMSLVGKCEAMMEGLVCRPEIELRDKQGNRIIVKIKHGDLKNIKGIVF